MFDWEASGLACNTQAATTPTDKARRLIILSTRADSGSSNPPERPLSLFGLNSPLPWPFTSDQRNCPADASSCRSARSNNRNHDWDPDAAASEPADQ